MLNGPNLILATPVEIGRIMTVDRTALGEGLTPRQTREFMERFIEEHIKDGQPYTTQTTSVAVLDAFEVIMCGATSLLEVYKRVHIIREGKVIALDEHEEPGYLAHFRLADLWIREKI